MCKGIANLFELLGLSLVKVSGTNLLILVWKNQPVTTSKTKQYFKLYLVVFSRLIQFLSRVQTSPNCKKSNRNLQNYDPIFEFSRGLEK
jgi:hypothetical protein